jgi:hypothetical protein
MNLTIASRPVANSSSGTSSDFFDDFGTDMADLAENIYVHYKSCNSHIENKFSFYSCISFILWT